MHIAGKGRKIEICAYRRDADNDYNGRNLKVWKTTYNEKERNQTKNADCADISPLSHFINISETNQECISTKQFLNGLAKMLLNM